MSRSLRRWRWHFRAGWTRRSSVPEKSNLQACKMWTRVRNIAILVDMGNGEKDHFASSLEQKVKDGNVPVTTCTSIPKKYRQTELVVGNSSPGCKSDVTAVWGRECAVGDQHSAAAMITCLNLKMSSRRSTKERCSSAWNSEMKSNRDRTNPPFGRFPPFFDLLWVDSLFILVDFPSVMVDSLLFFQEAVLSLDWSYWNLVLPEAQDSIYLLWWTIRQNGSTSTSVLRIGTLTYPVGGTLMYPLVYERVR